MWDGNVEPVIQNIIPDLKEEWKIPTFPRSIYRWTGPRNPFACPNLWDLKHNHSWESWKWNKSLTDNRL